MSSGESSPPFILCVHLLDDFSGSAKVFAHALRELSSRGAHIRVIVGSAGSEGFIRRSFEDVRTVFYRFARNRFLLLLNFIVAQLQLFLFVGLLCSLRRVDVVYANTVLNPGAVLAGRLFRRRVVVHVHEVGLGTPSLFKVLLWITRKCATRIICVSRYTRDALNVPPELAHVVYNTLSPRDWERANSIAQQQVRVKNRRFLVLMACSLKSYKGIDSFLLVAKRFESSAGSIARPVEFRLVLNCRHEEWIAFAASLDVPANVSIECRPEDVFDHYAEASLVMNLSHKEGWIETFGMTVLEALACGIPVIAPPVGGCAELLVDGVGGWLIDSRDLDAICSRVHLLTSDEQTWSISSAHARDAAQRFRTEFFGLELYKQVAGRAPTASVDTNVHRVGL